MKVAELLERRRQNWQELETLCETLQRRRRTKLSAEQIVRFSTLYRSACADLALADSYQLPPNTVQYLHRLVGRAHNQLYRAREFNFSVWLYTLLFEVPQRVFNDRCVQLTFCLFWGVFLLSCYLAWDTATWPDYAQQVLGNNTIETLETHFSEPVGRSAADNVYMAGYYINNNTGIGLSCFGGGLLVIPGLVITLFNAAFLGASFGYMARPDIEQGANFFHFVTAHGPCELTAIVLAAGTGLRLGMGWVYTRGLTRSAALRKTAIESMPIMGAAMVLFVIAAMIEGFLSPSSAPLWTKRLVALISSGGLMFYFVVLGFPRR